MASFKTLAVVAFGAVALSATARAADMPGNWPPPYEPKPPQTFTQMISGWYIRGDIGYRFNKIGSVEASSPATPVVSSNIDNVFSAGAGVGYKHSWFRTDLTVDYGSQAKFHGDVPGAASYYNMKIDTLTILGNAYIDLGTWYGFTPYIGAGAGTSYLRTADYTVASIGNSPIPTRANWSFSWAAMGGVSYQVLPNIAIDAGYRYLKIGDAKSGFEPPANTAFTTVKNLTAHEVRLGVRFLLD
jgi:opacity protein-like surface antigen